MVSLRRLGSPGKADALALDLDLGKYAEAVFAAVGV